jgi:hypothetical protein
MGGHNFIGDKSMPKIVYPDFGTFCRMLEAKHLFHDVKEDGFLKKDLFIMRSLKIIMIAVLLHLYTKVPKPAIYEAFGLEKPSEN